MKNFIKSIFAGTIIGIAALTSIGAGGSWYGAILFSIGLIIICIEDYNLYTGKIGYIKSYKEIPTMLLYMLGNFIGIVLISFTCNIDTSAVMAIKLANPLYLSFSKAIGCGFLMFIAVDIYKQKNSIIGVVCCIPAFILSGFEHSIADLFYIVNSGTFNLKVIIFFVIIIIGNAIGALLHKLLNK